MPRKKNKYDPGTGTWARPPTRWERFLENWWPWYSDRPSMGDSLRQIGDAYQRGTPAEKEELAEHASKFMSLFGVDEGKNAKITEAIAGKPKTTMSQKARELRRLSDELAQNIADDAEHEQEYRDIYDVERRKIMERES